MVSGGTLLSREAHRQGRFDLIVQKPDSNHYLIYELLDKTIIEDKGRRISNGAALAEEVGLLIRRIEMGAHAINLKAPQACNYCGTGSYQLVMDTRSQGIHSEGVWSHLRAYGLEPPYIQSNNWIIFRCDHCGNVSTSTIQWRPETRRHGGLDLRVDPDCLLEITIYHSSNTTTVTFLILAYRIVAQVPLRCLIRHYHLRTSGSASQIRTAWKAPRPHFQ